jgi:hypothetical protein
MRTDACVVFNGADMLCKSQATQRVMSTTARSVTMQVHTLMPEISVNGSGVAENRSLSAQLGSERGGAEEDDTGSQR